MASAGALIVFILALSATSHAQAGLSDLFSWGLDYIGSEPKSGEEPSLATRECSCDGPVCNCCVNFNVTFIDLGGPGCVKLKYLSQTDGLMVNVSYGNNVLHSEQVKGTKPEPACMDLLSDLAQVCARFTELTPEGDGLRGCTVMEPTLLGDVQTVYPVGCFTMGSDGMKLDPSREPVVSSSEEQSQEGDSSEGSAEKPDLSEEALINAVNESAEEGIAWFTSLLGLSFGGGGGKKNGTDPVETTSAATPSAAPAARAVPLPMQRQRSLNAIPV